MFKFDCDGTIELSEAEAIELRDRLNKEFPAKIGPWKAHKARGGWCVNRDVLGKTPDCAAAHCQNQEMAQRIAELLNGIE